MSEDKPWPKELEALENIKKGKTKMEIVDADEFIKELKELE